MENDALSFVRHFLKGLCRSSCHTSSILSITLLVLGINPSFAAEHELAAHHPKICIGYDPNYNQWGVEPIYTSDPGEYRCPKDYAFYGAVPPGGVVAPGAAVAAIGICCPLPASDILIEQEEYVPESCSSGFVAVGVNWQSLCDTLNLRVYRYGLCEEGQGPKLICQKINSKRYKLGEESLGGYWGFGTTRWHEEYYVSKNDIPIAIKYGLTRRSKYQWSDDGCISRPAGGVVTAKYSKRCDGIGFRQLLYIGVVGDPIAETPVKMFPDCEQIDDIFSKTPSCLK